MSISDGIIWDEQKIRQYFDECTARYENYYDKLTTLENCLRTFANDDEHKGEEADSARMFINDVQIPMLNDMARVIRLLQMKQQELLSEFDGIVDSAENTIVHEEKLKNVIKDFAGYLSSYDELADNISKMAKALNDSCSLGGMFDYTVPKKTSAIRAFEKMTDENGQNGLVPEHKKAVIGFDDEHKNDVGSVSEFGKLISMIRQNIRRIHSAAEGEDVSHVILDYKHQTELKKQLLRPENILSEEELKRYEAYIKQLEKYLRGEATRCSVFGSDPVNMTEGNYVGHWEDIYLPGRPSFGFIRYYNARSAENSILGKGWSNSFNQKITVKEINGDESQIFVYREDGSEHLYYRNKDGEISREVHGEEGKLKKSGKGFIVSFPDGKKEKYGDNGWIREISLREGGMIKIERDPEHPERLLQVKALNGNILKFLYDEDGYLTDIRDQAGRCVHYRYSVRENEEGRIKSLSEIKTLIGAVVRISYDENGRICTIGRDSDAPMLKNIYGVDGRISEQFYADGGYVRFKYNDAKNETEYTEQNGNVIRYIRDEKRRHIATVYENGTEYFKYDDRNNRISHTDRMGNTTRYTYDSKGRVTSIVNAVGDKISFTYDGKDHLYAVKRQDGSEWRFFYDTSGNIVKRVDPAHNTTRYKYDPLGECTEIEYPDGSKATARYMRGNITEIVDPAGGVHKFEYDELNRKIAEIDPEDNRSQFEYDVAGNATCIMSPLGYTTRYGYRFDGQIKSITYSDGTSTKAEFNSIGKKSEITDVSGNRTRLSYDIMMNLREMYLPNGGVVTLEYDKYQNMTAYTDPSGRKTEYELDPLGRIMEIRRGGMIIEKNTYDAVGRKVSCSDGDGNTWTYEYNSSGKIIKATNPEGHSTFFEYDSMDNLTAKIDALGNRYETRYDAMGRITESIDPDGYRTEYRYGALGNITEKLINGRSVEKYRYDRACRLIEVQKNDGYTLTYTYDADSRVTDVVSSEGTNVHLTYDSRGRITEKNDCGRIYSYKYTASGQIAEVTDPAGCKVSYKYNEMDQPVMIDRSGHVIVHKYGVDGLRISTIDALGHEERLEYDEVGRISVKTDREGNRTTYSYDGADNLTDICYGDGKTVHFGFDKVGNIRKITDWLGDTEIIRDALDRVVAISDYKGRKVEYEFGAIGEQRALVYPDGERTEYHYDDEHRLIELIHGQTKVNYSYDDEDRLAEKKYSNGNRMLYEYFPGGTIRSLTSMDAEGILDRYIYSQNEHGELVGVKRNRRNSPTLSGEWMYAYDEVGRLTEVVKDGVLLRKYGYDLFGNRTALEKNGQRTIYSYDEMDRLLSVRGGDLPEKEFQYDARGNLLEEYEGGVLKKRFSYTAGNWMSKVSDMNGREAEFGYNGLGFRVNSVVKDRKHTDRSIEYLCDMTKEAYNLLERTVNGEKEQYTWDSNVVGMSSAQGNYFYMNDEIGSPVYLTGTDGYAVQTYAYDEFGRELDVETGSPYTDARKRRQSRDYIKNGNIIQPFAFTGYQKDEIGEGLFAQVRHYCADLGRFIAEDQLHGVTTMPDSQNRYEYCLNSPVNYIDFNGLIPFPVLKGIDAHMTLQAHYLAMNIASKTFQIEVKKEVYIPIGIPDTKTGSGRTDLLLIDLKNHIIEVYEIKPSSYQTDDEKHEKGTTQLDNYINAINLILTSADKISFAGRNDWENWSVKKGKILDDDIRAMHFLDSKIFPNTKIEYWVEDGMIYYKHQFARKKKQTEVARETVKVREKALKMVGATAAVGVLVGGVVLLLDNFFTGGAGTIDDPVAISMISGALAKLSLYWNQFINGINALNPCLRR